MSSVNKQILLGFVGKDPDTKTFDSGVKASSISIATSESWKDKRTGEKKEATEWHNVKFFGVLSDIVSKYVRKGSKIYIEGKTTTRVWEKDGIKRYITEVVAEKLVLISSKSDSAPAAQGEYKADINYAQDDPFDSGSNVDKIPDGPTDDLPF